MSNTKIMTGKVRLSYPSLFKKAEFNGEEGKYEVTLMIPKDTDDGKKTIDDIEKAIKAAISDGIADKWGGKMPSKLDSPLKDGDESENEVYHGHMYIKAKTSKRPPVVDRNSEVIVDPAEIYGGCYARASISFWAYNYKGMNKGVSCILNAVQKWCDGEPFGGGGFSIDEFDDFPFADDEEDEF